MKGLLTLLLAVVMASSVQAQTFQEKWPWINNGIRAAGTNFVPKGVVTNEPAGGYIQYVGSNTWWVYFPVGGIVTQVITYVPPAKYLNVSGGLLTMSGDPTSGVNIVELTPASLIADGFARTDGTPETYWLVGKGANPMRLVKDANGFLIRNYLDTEYRDLVCRNLTVMGTNNVVVVTDVNIETNKLVLNANVTNGAPVLDASFCVSRGSSPTAMVQWVESSDRWMFGYAGEMFSLEDLATNAVALAWPGVLDIGGAGKTAVSNQWPWIMAITPAQIHNWDTIHVWSTNETYDAVTGRWTWVDSWWATWTNSAAYGVGAADTQRWNTAGLNGIDATNRVKQVEDWTNVWNWAVSDWSNHIARLIVAADTQRWNTAGVNGIDATNRVKRLEDSTNVWNWAASDWSNHIARLIVAADTQRWNQAGVDGVDATNRVKRLEDSTNIWNWAVSDWSNHIARLIVAADTQRWNTAGTTAIDATNRVKKLEDSTNVWNWAVSDWSNHIARLIVAADTQRWNTAGLTASAVSNEVDILQTNAATSLVLTEGTANSYSKTNDTWYLQIKTNYTGGGGGGITGLVSTAGGTSLVVGVAGSVATNKGLKAGTNITLGDDGTNVTITFNGSTGGTGVVQNLFLVYKNNENQTINANTLTKITWTNYIYGSGFDFTNNRYVVANDGYYLFSVTLSRTDTALEYETATITFYTNNVPTASYARGYTQADQAGKSSSHFAFYPYLKAGTYVEVYYKDPTYGNVIIGDSTNTWFAGKYMGQ